MSPDYDRERLDTILTSLGFTSFSELAETAPEEVVRRIDAVNPAPPVNAADAFLGVMVVSAVAELRKSAERLDDARKRLDLIASGVSVGALAVLS